MRVLLCIVAPMVFAAGPAPGASAFQGEGLRVSSRNHRCFVYGGRPFYLIGSGMESHCQKWSDSLQKWYDYMDMLARNGFNRVRFFLWDMLWQKELKPHFSPWKVRKAGPFDFDLTAFNPRYWAFVKDILRYALKKGIVVEYVLFDYCSLRGAEWAKNPLAEANGGAVPGKVGKPGIFAFADYNDLDLFKQEFKESWPWRKKNQWFQQLYVKYTIDQLTSFPNIYWEIMNEQGWRRVDKWGPEWTGHWLEFLDKYDKKRHLRSINAADVYDRMPGIDIVCEHPIPFFNKKWKGPEDAVALIRNALKFGKPVVCDETGFYPPPASTDDAVWRKVTPEQMANERRGFWYAFVAGGHWTAVCWQDFKEQQRHRWVRKFANFVARVPYWRMDPHDELVTGGHCLCEPGGNYVVYLGKGGTVKVNLTALPRGTGRALWFDPRTGRSTPIAEPVGGARREFTSPSAADWVLWIRR